MAIRHFKKVISADILEYTSSDSDETQEEQENTCELVDSATSKCKSEETTVQTSNNSVSSFTNKITNTTINCTSEEESVTSEDSSDEIIFHKPIFLKRKKHSPNVSDNLTKSEEVMQRIMYYNSVQDKTELIQKISDNYGTNQEILNQILNLNDDDNENPNYEYKIWTERQDERIKRIRDIKLEEQLKLEDYESNKLENKGNSLIDNTIDGLQFEYQNRINIGNSKRRCSEIANEDISTLKIPQKHRKSLYQDISISKPQIPTNTTLSNFRNNGKCCEENEYSII